MFRPLVLALLCGFAHAAPPPFEDSMAQRTLACVACHGREGRAGPDGYYPRIAGKPQGYLYNQLLNFRDGRRHYGLMAGLLDPLSDRYLSEIAGHFAQLQVPYPPPQPANLPVEAMERGRVLATQGDAGQRIPACASCHGKAFMGTEPAVPGLLGLPRDYLNAQLGAWRTGQRRAHAPDCMGEIARRLAPDDVLAVTGWLSSQAVSAQARVAAAASNARRPAAARAGPKSRRTLAQAPPAPPAPPMQCGTAPLPARAPA